MDKIRLHPSSKAAWRALHNDQDVGRQRTRPLPPEEDLEPLLLDL